MNIVNYILILFLLRSYYYILTAMSVLTCIIAHISARSYVQHLLVLMSNTYSDIYYISSMLCQKIFFIYILYSNTKNMLLLF